MFDSFKCVMTATAPLRASACNWYVLIRLPSSPCPRAPGAARRSAKVGERFSASRCARTEHETIANITARKEQEDGYSLDADPAVSMGSTDQHRPALTSTDKHRPRLTQAVFSLPTKNSTHQDHGAKWRCTRRRALRPAFSAECRRDPRCDRAIRSGNGESHQSRAYAPASWPHRRPRERRRLHSTRSPTWPLAQPHDRPPACGRAPIPEIRSR